MAFFLASYVKMARYRPRIIRWLLRRILKEELSKSKYKAVIDEA
jgi:hypothetical protein